MRFMAFAMVPIMTMMPAVTFCSEIESHSLNVICAVKILISLLTLS